MINISYDCEVSSSNFCRLDRFKQINQHYENKLTKNIRPTDILQIYTEYLVNVHKFTKYLVNSYHQKGVKHYALTNWNQIKPI